MRRNVRIGRAGAVATLVFASVLVASPTASAAEAGPPLPFTSHDVQIRRDLGLRADDAYLQELAQQPLTPSPFSDSPVSSEEKALLDARMASQARLAPIVSAFDAAQKGASGSTYGGIYYDLPAGGDLVVASTTDPDGLVAALRDVLPGDIAMGISGRLVERSFSALTDLADRVTNERALWSVQGVRITSVSPDVIANDVEIGIDPSSNERAETLLTAAYGPGSRVVRRAPSDAAADRNSDWVSVRAGLRIQRVASPTTLASCTANFAVKKGTSYYIMSAGHCGGGAWYEGYYNSATSHGKALGSVQLNKWADGTSCDCLITGPVSASIVSGYIYMSSTWMQGIRGSGAPIVGATACYSGASTATNAWECGTVLNTDYRFQSTTGFWLNHQVNVHYGGMVPGDSGSPAFDGYYTAFGIGSHSNPTADTWSYTSMSYTASGLGWTGLVVCGC
jgi:hypothetical protein